MAVLLSSGGARSEAPGAGYEPAVGVQAAPVDVSAMTSVATSHGIHETACREKKHACTMCHKRFDRPSTLRKHLLVHTGEKAFVCDICGRRFGVASNLNRHVKRCALKPVNMTVCSPPKSDSPSSDETSPQTSPISQSPEHSFTRSPNVSHKRGSISSVSSSSCSSSRGRSSMSPLQVHHSVPTGAPKAGSTQKRRRRAPSPSRWVPLSLLSFNLSSEDMFRSVSVPLAPVRRNLPKEERDSWDENVAPTPYHPTKGWKGVLAGPGLPSHQGMRGKDIGKMHYGGGSGTFMVSRLLAV
ncbi:hypothetical protein DFP72DRAFT_807277 [Ephemerocybe angulata]|uniref:C2H2-type domain-containing protein n=1 Tax=Ephemerocybe angulata TaxID=980116 RepID=A0A8H6I4Q6_9AGAR|nr:hypothetical protein DFP72DRAFT_807277 [Tulosesus angulatus]